MVVELFITKFMDILRYLMMLAFTMLLCSWGEKGYQQLNTTSPQFFPASDSALAESPIEKHLFYLQKSVGSDQVFVHLDRNIYQPGDTIFFQAYIRDRFTGVFQSKSVSFYALLLNEKGEMADSSRYKVDNSTASGWMTVPQNAALGKYHFSAFTSQMQNYNPVEAFQVDLIVKEAESNPYRISVIFKKEIYKTSDTLEASVNIGDLKGNPINRQRFYASLTTGNLVAKSKDTETNSKGESLIRFILPDSIHATPVFKVIIRQSKGKAEITRKVEVPYDDPHVELRFLPEGGTFIHGIKQRIGFNATSFNGKPVQIEGLLKNSSGIVLDTIRSGVYGPGSFICEIKSGLYVELTKGAGVEKIWPLPDPSLSGLALSVAPLSKRLVKVLIQSNSYNGQQVTVTGTLNMVQFFSQKCNLDKKQQIIINTDSLPSGVANITLFDKELKPVAERLIYLNSDKHLQFNVQTDAKSYLPDSETELSILVSDGEGRQSEGFFSIAVTDSVRGIDQQLFIPGIEYTYNYHPFFPGNLPPKVLSKGIENLSDKERDLILMVYGWSKITWDFKKNQPERMLTINWDLLKLKVLYAGKNRRQNRSLDLISLEDVTTRHLVTDPKGEISLLLDSLSQATASVMIMPDVKNKNKALGAMLSIPYNEQYFKSNQLILPQPLLSDGEYSVAPADQPFAMEEKTIEIPEVVVIGHQRILKEYHDEYEAVYQYANVKSLDYEALWSSTSLESAIRKLINPYQITTNAIYLHPTFSIIYGSVPALFVLDGMPIYQDGWRTVNVISTSEITSLTILPGKQGFTRYGGSAQGGVIFINTRSSNPNLQKERVKWKMQNSNDKMLLPISIYRPRVECYNPTRQDLDQDPLLQRRATLLWQSEIYFGGNAPVKIKIPNLNHTGPVVITINGVSVTNLIGSGRASYQLK